MLNRFGMTECNPMTTPMEQNLNLTSIEGKEFEDATKYRQLVGSLNYLTTTRPDISFVVGSLSRFMQKPCEGYWPTAKSVLKYLKGTQDFEIKYTQFQQIPQQRQNMWQQLRQQKKLCLRKILEDLQVKQVQSTPLMNDNTSAINLAKNPKFHDRTKHINTKYHLIRHHVETKTIHLGHCSTNEKIADIFTNSLGREKLERFKTMIGPTNIPSN
eukprot:PITA_31523